MTAECRVGAPGIELRECERPRSRESVVPWLPIALVLALVLIGGLAIINLPVREALPGADVSAMARVEAVKTDSPLAGPEYWLSRSRLALGQAAAVESDSPLAGPEYLVSRSRSATERLPEVASTSPSAGPESLVFRSRLPMARLAAVESGSPLAGPEYWVSRSR